MTDAELVERARQGDRVAFGDLIDRHERAVYRAVTAALGSRMDADDAVQEAFLAAYRGLDAFRGEASFRTWLLTIAWRQAINQRRAVARWWRRIASGTGPRVNEEESGDSGDRREDRWAGSTRSPEEALSDERLRQEIARQIRALPRKLRDALLLARTGEHSYEEIATMLNAPIGTIKWRVSEARRVIRQRLRACGYTNVG